jgi:hypothetical protein
VGVLLLQRNLSQWFGVCFRARRKELAPLAECAKIENEFVLLMMTVRKHGEFRLLRAQDPPISSIYCQLLVVSNSKALYNFSISNSLPT